jgi:hypothetical protein
LTDKRKVVLKDDLGTIVLRGEETDIFGSEDVDTIYESLRRQAWARKNKKRIDRKLTNAAKKIHGKIKYKKPAERMIKKFWKEYFKTYTADEIEDKMWKKEDDACNAYMKCCKELSKADDEGRGTKRIRKKRRDLLDKWNEAEQKYDQWSKKYKKIKKQQAKEEAMARLFR